MVDQPQVAAQMEAQSAEAQAEGVLPLIQLISDLVEKRCDRFLSTRYGLTAPQFDLLMAAVQQTDMTLGGLSEQLNCSRGNVTGIVDRLERDEWLKRERSTHDRRVITVKLTEKGYRIWEIKEDLAKEMANWSQVWDASHRRSLSTLLMSIYKDLKAE